MRQVLNAFDEVFESRVSVGLVECEVDCVLVVLEVVFEGEEVVVFGGVVVAGQVDVPESHFVSSLEPVRALLPTWMGAY